MKAVIDGKLEVNVAAITTNPADGNVLGIVLEYSIDNVAFGKEQIGFKEPVKAEDALDVVLADRKWKKAAKIITMQEVPRAHSVEG